MAYTHVDPKTHRKTTVSLCPSDCFESVGLRHSVAPLGAGHGCSNRLGRRIGYEQLEFCWSPIAKDSNYTKIKNALSGNGFYTLPKRAGGQRDGAGLAVYVNRLGLLGLNESAAAATTRSSIQDRLGVDERIRVTNQTHFHEGSAWWIKYIRQHGG